MAKLPEERLQLSILKSGGLGEVNATWQNDKPENLRLAIFARNLFEFARPQHIVLTTPNAEYNTVFGMLPAGEFRHGDHRFEWTRAQFDQWTGEVASRFGYTVRVRPVGPEEPGHGAPTQMAVFARKEVSA